MKSLIVFYLPSKSAPISKKNRKRIRKSFEKSRPEGSNIILIEDPTIDCVHTEVFFNPY